MPPRKQPANPEEPQEKKPRAKRTKASAKHQVVAVVTPDGIQGTFQPEVKRPLIVHLPIHSNDIQFHDQPFVYDPRPPGQFEAFNAGEVDPFSSEATYEVVPTGGESGTQNEVVQEAVVTETPDQVTSAPTATATPKREYGPTKLLVSFASSKQTKELPSESSVACFWCCEHFTGRPCVVPSQIVDQVWQVYGNFCTPQCAMAYLLSEILDTHTRWERIALLNRLYASSCHGRVYPAPSRESLQRFGGPISAEDFRAICEEQRIRVDIHLPPMVSILASMDTKPIDFYETPLRNTFASPYQMQVTRPTDEPKGLKLKRSKPLKDKESTLDACLNIVVKA